VGKLSGKAVQFSTLDRRGFVKSSAVVAGGLLGFSFDGSLAYADALTREQRDKMTPDEMIAIMK
jgi:hypothetical protein